MFKRTTTQVARPSVQRAQADSAATKQPLRVLFIGTSLTAGYGLSPDQAYPALIEQRARNMGIPLTAINAGVSGETSAGALNRIDWVLKTPADIIVLETGANDALRGLPVSEARSNISKLVERIKRAQPGRPILLVQMEAPPNLGQVYTAEFHDMYGEIAQANGATLVPFLLQGVAGETNLNQADGLHPNVIGERIVATNVWRALGPVVRRVALFRSSPVGGG